MKILRPILLAVVGFFVLAQTVQAHYDPKIGRWISRDPIEESGGDNLYGFVINRPTRFHDYLGLSISILGVDENDRRIKGRYSLEQIAAANRHFRESITKQLRGICPLVRVDGNGGVSMDAGPPSPKYKAGCCCLQELIGNDKANAIKLRPYLSVGTRPDEPGGNANDGPEIGPPSSGGGASTTTFINPREEWVQNSEGEWVTIPDHIILAHELCGHMLDYNRGIHPKYTLHKQKDTPPHETWPVYIENIIRDEAGFPFKRPPGFGNEDVIKPQITRPWPN